MRLTLRILLVATAVLMLGLTVSKRLNSNRKSAGLYVNLPGHAANSGCGDSNLVTGEIFVEKVLKYFQAPAERYLNMLKPKRMRTAEQMALDREGKSK